LRGMATSNDVGYEIILGLTIIIAVIAIVLYFFLLVSYGALKSIRKLKFLFWIILLDMIIFILQSISNRMTSTGFCYFNEVVFRFFQLCEFGFSLTMAFDIFWRVKKLKQNKYFPWYFAGVVISSAVFTGLGIAVGRFQSRPASPCITGLNGLIPFFYIPYFLSTLIEIGLFIAIITMVRKIQQNKTKQKTHRKEFSTWVVVGVSLGFVRIPLYILGAFSLLDANFTWQANLGLFAVLQVSTLVQPYAVFGAVVHNHKLFRKWKDRCTGRQSSSSAVSEADTKGRSDKEQLNLKLS